MNFINYIKNKALKIQYSSDRGFTLVEILVVASITVMLTTILVLNFSRSRVNVEEAANLLISNIRIVQSKAVVTEKFNGYYPCGFGLHYRNATSYSAYAGPDSSTTDCTTQNRNMGAGDNEITPYYQFIDSKIGFKNSFNDIFFEPPDPRTYLNNVLSLSQPPQAITIGKITGTCPQDCKTICVYPTGRVEASSSASCP